MIINIVFDLDGTIITCENKQKYLLYSIIKRNLGNDFTKVNQWWVLKRNGFNTENALHELKIPHAKKISSEWINSIEDFIWSSLDRPFKDSLLTMKFLKEKFHMNLSILTARKNKVSLFQTIYRAGFERYIDDVIIVNPKNTINEKSAYLIKNHPIIYLGDTELDYLAAKNAQTGFIALSRGQRSSEFLSKCGEIKIENNLSLLMNEKFIIKLLETNH